MLGTPDKVTKKDDRPTYEKKVKRTGTTTGPDIPWTIIKTKDGNTVITSYPR